MIHFGLSAVCVYNITTNWQSGGMGGWLAAETGVAGAHIL